MSNDWVEIRVKDIEKTADFYENLFGKQLVCQFRKKDKEAIEMIRVPTHRTPFAVDLTKTATGCIFFVDTWKGGVA